MHDIYAMLTLTRFSLSLMAPIYASFSRSLALRFSFSRLQFSTRTHIGFLWRCAERVANIAFLNFRG